MKKALLALALLTGGAVTTASAQVEIGLKVSPSVSSLAASSPSQYNFEKDGSLGSIGGGLVVDYFFGQNYAFSTGLQLTGKGGTITYYDPLLTGTGNNVTFKQKVRLQYVEVPVTVKLFTNEVATDVKLYFQVGGVVSGLSGGRINDEKYFTDPANGNEQKRSRSHFLFADFGLLGGTGVEYQLGQSTKVFAGVSYHHGLLNVDRFFDNTRKYKDVSIKNREIALDLGLKF
ncbi:PorT family protein [Hymenobacter sp. 15J16-1T3B]|uniref:outer membrane beta-barrel protein n=1 Tax=Hymenobacter sp. 15J16-1T3B TaxID=2886941 RepID=UPI001D106A59|nr:outer membrane beta-barrel protein [Hymenobacter sp. 15J16-1T3B]MCC3155652.1 PorT family protein [Hymenobacter sp. 15J16-1T3B]